MKSAAVVVVAAALVLPAAQAAERKGVQPVLGLSPAKDGLLHLAWFDPLTLQTIRGRKPPLGANTEGWSFSPDGSRIAIATEQPARGIPKGVFAPQLRFVNLRTMRVLGEVDVGEGAMFHTITWLRPDRLLAVTTGTPPTVALVNPTDRTLVRRVPLPRPVSNAARLSDGLALLLGSSGSFAPAVVAVANADGEVRTVTLDRISIGLVRQADDKFEIRTPGFAVDTATRRAFVVGEDFTVAVVDLDTFSVSYHGGRTRSLAKYGTTGPYRQALWLGGGLLAVTGGDYPGDGTPPRPVGLRLIDTGDWQTRLGDHEIGQVHLFASSRIFYGNPASDLTQFSVYGIDGSLHYRFKPSGGRWLNFEGPYAYICQGRTERVVQVLDAATGRTVRIPRVPRPACPRGLLYEQNY